MGVIYRAGDDVGELLVPFLREHGCTQDRGVIETYYRVASLGQISARHFWDTMGVNPHLEDEYLSRHECVPELNAFLEWARWAGIQMACLSNDVSEWSLKLRRRFGLESYIRQWAVSGDLGVRKPDGLIYEKAIQMFGRAPDELLFVDDRVPNVRAGRLSGMNAVLFSADRGHRDDAEPSVGFPELRALLERRSGFAKNI